MSGSAHEMDANAKAVEVIQVWGYSEREAVVMVGGLLCRRQAWGVSASRAGHLSAAAELENLKARFNTPMFHCLSPKVMMDPAPEEPQSPQDAPDGS